MPDIVPAMQFIFTLVAEVILTLIVLTYAMHCMIVVARDTAAGRDEVTWPEEPFQDWVGGALGLVVVVVVWLAPVGLLARALRQTWLPDAPAALRFLLLAVPGLWLFFPVALLSSLSGSSRWFVFRPVVVWNLLRVAPTTFAVYLLSALLAAATAALGYAAVVGGWIVLAPVAAAWAAAAFLIYARLLGRLAWTMGRLSSGSRKAAKKERPKVKSVEGSDPWAAPEEAEVAEVPLPETETTPYGRTRKRVKGYGLASEPAATASEITPTPDPAQSVTARPPSPADREPVPRERPKRAAGSRRSLLAGVFTFPWYAQTRRAWLLLSLGFLVVGAAAWFLLILFQQLSR